VSQLDHIKPAHLSSHQRVIDIKEKHHNLVDNMVKSFLLISHWIKLVIVLIWSCNDWMSKIPSKYFHTIAKFPKQKKVEKTTKEQRTL
jgi:hypothetical protein